MKIAIFGGSFNPIHNGHLLLAEYLRDEFSIDKVIFVPVGTPSHRANNLLKASVRYKMVEIAIKNNENFDISDIEIRSNQKSYTIDTLRALKKKYPNDEIYEIVGEDSADYIHKWKNYEELVKLAKILVFQRANYNYKSTHENIILANNPLIEISSSHIRDRIRKNKSIKYMIPESIETYIKQNNLYKEN